MATYETLSGRRLEYSEPAEPLARFLERVRAAVDDASVSEAALIDLVYSQENPLLERDIITGRGAVTPKVFADPLYHVMTDMIGRKRVALGLLNLEKAAAQFTLTVSEAAARLGVHASAIRQAIQNHRLPAWNKDGQWFLEPASLNAFKPERRGPVGSSAPALEVRMGLRPGESLRLRDVDTSGLVQDDSGAWCGQLRAWTQIVALAARGDKARCFVLVPSENPNAIEHGDLFVRGRFDVLETINNPCKARERFKAAKVLGRELD